MILACVDFVIFEYAKLFKKLQSGNMDPEERLARLVKERNMAEEMRWYSTMEARGNIRYQTDRDDYSGISEGLK